MLSIPSWICSKYFFRSKRTNRPEDQTIKNDCNGNRSPAPPNPANVEERCLLEVSAPVQNPRAKRNDHASQSAIYDYENQLW
jgi:hypothetical protein